MMRYLHQRSTSAGFRLALTCSTFPSGVTCRGMLSNVGAAAADARCTDRVAATGVACRL